MVHKKYIKLNGKTYGPYYYESYRENGKIKKRYIKYSLHKNKRRVKLFWIYYFTILFILFSLVLGRFIYVQEVSIPEELLLAPPGASSVSNENANLTIWDDTDYEDTERFTACEKYCQEKIKPYSVWNTFFYANYTDLSGNPIDDSNGLCQIRYDFGLGFTDFENMVYNPSYQEWRTNRTFNYKGTHNFEVNCTSIFGNVLTDNAFVLENSAPYITQTASGYIDFNVDGNKDTLSCIEDIPCYYEFNLNVSEDDYNDILIYNYMPSENTTLTNFSINSNTGLLIVNVTHTIDTGLKKIELTVKDTESPTKSALLEVFIQNINDAPYFLNLENKSFNRSELFTYTIFAEDEENDLPLTFNISFINCTPAQWSSRNKGDDKDCVLFNSSHYTTTENSLTISFTPNRDDVGEYIINFSVTDLNNSVLPYNASSSTVVNFTVINLNLDPELEYVCDNEREATEDSPFVCIINATDIDETNNLTFISDHEWFLNITSVPVNVTTNFSGEIRVSFTSTDLQVGNWTINISVYDTGAPRGYDTKIINFSVFNIHDKVYLDEISDILAYTSNTYHSEYINASDDDLLIQDKSVYDEELTFSSNYTGCVFVSPKENKPNTSIMTALIEFNPSDILCFIGEQDYFVNISVTDKSGNIDSKIVRIAIKTNNAPVWKPDTQTNHILEEDIKFYWNLSNNVTDADNDPITFNFTVTGPFPNFFLNSTTGVIEFTPLDADIGEHLVNISAFDGATFVYLLFNFTIINVNDTPVIETPLQGNNIIIDKDSNMITDEDNLVDIFLFAIDEDLEILQKDFYHETLFLNLTIEGPNSNLFEFQEPNYIFPNKNLFTASFIPKKSDIGVYNITINITDSSGLSNTILFNLTINEINHKPVLMNLTDQGTIPELEIYYDINATDVEDGSDEDGLLKFSYTFLEGEDFIQNDESIFNTTSGELRYTFYTEEGSKYHLNITVTDTGGLTDHKDFWIFIYGPPTIQYPNENTIFNLKEGVTSPLLFMANHTVGNNLSYKFFLDNDLRYNLSYYGNGSFLNLQFTPNFEDETYGLFKNLTLLVSIPSLPFLNDSRTWNANITHNNSPIYFIKNIPDMQSTFASPTIIDLREHFYDPDVYDIWNQMVGFVVAGSVISGDITYTINGWNLTFNSNKVSEGLFNITASDLDSFGNPMTNATSNNFKIKFVEPPLIERPRPQPESGGGSTGKSTIEKPVSLKIILPDPISAKKGEILELPIALFNNGQIPLKEINLSAQAAKNGQLREDLEIELSKVFFSELNPGMRENLTLRVKVGENELGLFELTIYADVKTPKYSDWGKVYIDVEEGMTVTEKLVFTEEFIVENPECLELKELVDEAKKSFKEGDFDSAKRLLDEAISACKRSIEQKSTIRKKNSKINFQDKVFIYLSLATLVAIAFGIAYYLYQKKLLKEALVETGKSKEKEDMFDKTY